MVTMRVERPLLMRCATPARSNEVKLKALSSPLSSTPPAAARTNCRCSVCAAGDATNRSRALVTGRRMMAVPSHRIGLAP
jgi:hypothetical protein